MSPPCSCRDAGSRNAKSNDEAVMHWSLRGVTAAYRFAVSPVLHAVQRTLTGSIGSCRFQPSCFEYATLALHLHGPVRGGLLAMRRILRCHPLGKGGYDPVPASDEVAQTKVARHLP